MKLSKLLLRIFSFSFILTIILMIIYALIIKGQLYDILVQLMFVGSFVFSIGLTIAAIPGSVISLKAGNEKSKVIFGILCIPVLISLYFTFFSNLQPADYSPCLIAVLSSVIVQLFLFLKRTPLRIPDMEGTNL